MAEFPSLTDNQFIYVLLVIFVINFIVNFVLPSPNLYKKPNGIKYSLNKFYTVFANSSLISLMALCVLAFIRKHIGNKENILTPKNIVVFIFFTASYIAFSVCASEQLGINDNDLRRSVEEHRAIIIKMADEKKHVRNIPENDKQKYQRIIDINTYDVFENDKDNQTNPPKPSIPSNPPPSKPSVPSNPPPSKPSVPSYQSNPSIPSKPSIPSNEMSNNPSNPSNPTYPSSNYPSDEMSNSPSSNPPDPNEPHNNPSLEHMTMLFV